MVHANKPTILWKWRVLLKYIYSVADPGFSEAGRQPARGGPTHDFAKISAKLDEIETIWMPGEAHCHGPGYQRTNQE